MLGKWKKLMHLVHKIKNAYAINFFSCEVHWFSDELISNQSLR